MFKIDLLEGQGIPIKSTPAGLAIAAAASTVPVIGLIVVVGCFMVNSVNISHAENSITRFTTMKEQLSEKVSSLKAIEQEMNEINSSLDEVSSSFYRHTQWTNVLKTVSENMPDSMVLSEFQVKQRPLNKQVPNKSNLEELIFISIPVRTLRMRVSGNSAYDYAEAVKDFAERLRFSEALKDILADIRISQGSDTSEGHDVVYYEIECQFKPGM
ncbi:MAG: hypothetical protein ACYTBP_06915 [Planctomycetota bacterium]|jgi:chaperonin cofactor prefoldin